MLIVYLPFSLLYLMFNTIVGVACVQIPTADNPDAHGLNAMGWIMDIFFFLVCFAIPIFIVYNCIRNIRAGKAKDIPFLGFLRLVN